MFVSLSGKFAEAFEGFLRKQKGEDQVEFHVKRVEGETVCCVKRTNMKQCLYLATLF